MLANSWWKDLCKESLAARGGAYSRCNDIEEHDGSKVKRIYTEKWQLTDEWVRRDLLFVQSFSNTMSI